MTDTVLELAAPARIPQITALRHAADAFLKQLIRDDLRYQLLLVVSELCTNAVEAVHNPRAELTLRIRDLEDCILVEVENLGPGFSSAISKPGAGDDDERGRGMQVVQSLVDEMSVHRFRDRTIVQCVVRKT